MFNNKTKTFLLLTLLFITIMGVSAATAADVDNDATDVPTIAEETNSQTDIACDNSIQNDVSNKKTQITKTTTENIKGNDETANFTSLETDIKGSDVTLSKDYVQGEGESNITITSDKIIDGAGHTITSHAGMFIIENGVTLTVNNLIVNATHGPTYSYYWYDFYDKGSLILNNVTFNYIGLNRTYGGQVYVDANANLTVTDSLFNGEDNVRSQIYANGNDYRISIDKSTFTNYNTQYSAIDLNKRGNLTVTNSKFINNIMGDNGGAIYVNTKDCVVLVEKCTFENLTAKYRGGGICANYGYVTVKDSTFRNLVQNATSNNAGAIFVGYNTASLNLKNNVMEDNKANAADVYFAAGNCTSDINVAGADITAAQEGPATLVLNVTDDNGNTVDFRTSPFVIKINDETITAKYANGTITANFDASYEPGTYDINITYNDEKLLGNVALPKIKLTVNDIGLLSYANVTEKIASATEGSTVMLDGPVFRKANEDSIVISKNAIELNLNGNTINAKGGKIFEIADGIDEVTIKDAVITNIGNDNPTLNNTQGRFIIANNTHMILEGVEFVDNIATDMSSSPGSFIFAVDAVVLVEDCYVSNSSGTFINNVKSNVYITDSVFENNNLYKSSSVNWNALISDGGYLVVRDSEFINNKINFAVIDGQSQTLSMFAYGSSLLFNNQELIIDNCIFKDNYGSSGKAGAIHTYNDTTVTNSIFINNKINGYSNYGGAINSEDGKLTVDSCIFVNNSARYVVSSHSGNDGTAIYNKAGDLSIKNSMIISNITELAAVYNAASGVSIDINGNYWGNATPEGFIKSTSSGDVMTTDDWAVLNVTVEPSENIKYQDTVTAKAFFTKNTDGSQITTLPDYGAATFAATGGTLSEETVAMENSAAKTTFNVGYNPFIITASYPNMEAEYYGEAIMPEPELIVLNDGNWTAYFNDDGTLKDTIIPDTELQFEGEFTDRFMIINIPVKITTAQKQGVLNDCTFLVVSDYVRITNLEMNNNNMEDAPIIVEDSSNVIIESNIINVTNNEDKMETRAIVIDGGAYNVIRNNTITTVGPEDNIQYNSDYSMRIYTTSIEADSDYLLIDSNKITTRKNENEAELLGTIYGIYIHGTDSENPIAYPYIFDNEIVTEGEVYIYGIKVHYANNAYINNNTVTGTSNLFTSGIHVFVISDSKIVKNVVDSKASDITYGIVLEGAMDYSTYAVISTENTVVSDNVVNVESDLAWAIETYAGIENNIMYNNITVNANNGLGIGLTDQDSTVSYNNINVYSKDTSAKAASYDYIDPYTTGIKIANNGLQAVRDNEITYNNITVVADKDEIPGVNSSTNYNTITDNFIVSPRGLGDEGVVDTGRYGTVENNLPSTSMLTDESYSIFFDENCSLKPIFNNAKIKVSGEFVDNTVFIFDDVNVTLTSDGTAVFYDGQMWTGPGATVTFDGLVFNNTMDAFVLESQGNTIKNTVINIDSDDEIHAIYVYDDNNVISNTRLNIVAPSANVIYNPDYSVNTPAPAAIVISSNNNIIEGVEIYFDGREAIHNPDPEAWDAPTVDGIYLVSSTTPIENNTIVDTDIEVIGCNYAYGINVGNAKNTVLDEIYVDVSSDYYADAIQLFDADTITITGEVEATAGSEAYGVYSTAMGTGFSKNIDLTDLDISVTASKATGVLLEGSSNVTIADAGYVINGDETTAIIAAEDWMYNTPTNITITNMDIGLYGTEDNSVLKFIKADTVILTDSNIESTKGSEILFNQTPNSQVVGNYIKINEVIFGNFAVVTTESDTVIENNTPRSQKMEEMQQTIDELQKEIDELKAAKNTSIIFDEITDAKYNGNVTISGALVNDDYIGLFNQIVTLTIGETEVNVTTKGGIFEYTTSFKEVGEKTVTATYAGNEKYRASNATITFNVDKQDVTIAYNPIEDVQYKDNVTITGILTEVTGKALNNVNALIKVNGKLYKVKTDKTGAFTLTITATALGTNNITLGYAGNANYNSYETKTTFNVDKQDIIIAYDAIMDTQYKDNVTITGTVTDANGNALKNINVLIHINGILFKAKTDGNGSFMLSVAATTIGTNNVTLSYGGNANYNGYETTTTFNVDKQNITITYKPIKDTVAGDNVTITGTVTDVTGKALYNINVNIRINGKLFKAKTDNTGAFTLTTTATTAGVNNVTLSYAGNANYNSYETNTTFNVIAKA